MSATRKITTSKPGDIHALLTTALEGWGGDCLLLIHRSGDKPVTGLQRVARGVDAELSVPVWEIDITIYGDGERIASDVS